MCGSNITDMRTLPLVLMGLLHGVLQLHNTLANTAKSICFTLMFVPVQLYCSVAPGTRRDACLLYSCGAIPVRAGALLNPPGMSRTLQVPVQVQYRSSKGIS